MSTPALARATEALAAAQRRTVTPMHALDARTAVSAALHDPDDSDWLQVVIDRAIVENHKDLRSTRKSRVYRGEKAVADAIIRAILGEAS